MPPFPFIKLPCSIHFGIRCQDMHDRQLSIFTIPRKVNGTIKSGDIFAARTPCRGRQQKSPCSTRQIYLNKMRQFTRHHQFCAMNINPFFYLSINHLRLSMRRMALLGKAEHAQQSSLFIMKKQINEDVVF